MSIANQIADESIESETLCAEPIAPTLVDSTESNSSEEALLFGRYRVIQGL